MRSFPAKALLGIALTSAIVFSVSGQAGAASRGAILQTANADSHAGTVELSAKKKKNKSRRSRSRSDAAVAAGILGIIGGFVAADQYRGDDRGYWGRDGYYRDGYDDDYYYERGRRPRYRDNSRRRPGGCPGGRWVDEGGRVHCE